MTVGVSSSKRLEYILRNGGRTYEGDLCKYFQVLFFEASNVNAPYHNFRHMLHVVWLCYQGGLYYAGTLGPRRARNLLVAAMFHDFDHALLPCDNENVKLAIKGFEKHALPEDLPYKKEIADLIRATEFPHKTPSEELSLEAQILRDADLAQCFSSAYLQQIVFGLAKEKGISPMKMLKLQESFLNSFSPVTEWGRKTFSRKVIEEKIAGLRSLVMILEEEI